MALTKTKGGLQNFERSIENEWLETNGLGGFANSTLIGCNTRRYHGLLVAATAPPVERMNLVNKIDETIVMGEKRFELGVNDYGATIHPTGYSHLFVFKKEFFPEWIYEVNEVVLRKTIFMVHNENTTCILYEVVSSPGKFELELLPLLSVRSYHSLVKANDSVNKELSFQNDVLKTKLYEGTPDLFIKVPGSDFRHDAHWYNNLNYISEKERGLEHLEDLYSPGKFSISLEKGDSIGIILSTEDPVDKNVVDLFAREKERRKKLLEKHPRDEALQQLLLAADQFIVRRDEELKSIIAGYPWFTDWGRDAMISLPGLCLSTGRFDDAKKILSAFAKNVSMGMLPNRFNDYNELPEYNTVDGTLWYFVAIHKYLVVTADQHFVLNELLPVLKEIIDYHFEGTRYNIRVDDDGLLFAGEPGTQLTWMDAKVGDWVVTPRIGKPVEIQALWYNALRIFANLLRLNKQEDDAQLVDFSAEKARLSFNSMFWNDQGKYLYDLIGADNIPDPSLRPNQLFAISLPFSLIEEDAKVSSILSIIEEKLYTPVGLRSLAPGDRSYKGKYQGNRQSRDAAYHQGTVWSWLLGPYADTIAKIEGRGERLNAVFRDFKYHLNEAGIGTVSEIFDGDPPFHPRGCIAQAWGVAELLRIAIDHSLIDTSFQTEKKINGVDMMQRLAK